jgi:FdhD protein
MRTPNNDEDLITGLLFCEGIINKKSEIEKVEFLGDKVGKFKIQNKIQITLNNGENLDIKHLRRNFLTNSSCGVCGKTSIDSLEIICKTKINKNNPKIKNSLITKIPNLLMQNQSEFSKTGGIHASALFNSDGKPLIIREDVGRHNALDKVIGHSFQNSIFDTKNQFIACSGRLSFELVQKSLIANIGLLMGVGAPTSLAIDLAKRSDMTLIGFVKSDSFNIYCGENRILKTKKYVKKFK